MKLFPLRLGRLQSEIRPEFFPRIRRQPGISFDLFCGVSKVLHRLLLASCVRQWP